jgi:phytanoyl-CoA hydroxylase
MNATDIRSIFERDGFVVIDGVVAPDTLVSLRERAASLVDEFVDADAPAFTTRNDAPSRDAYFLESATTIRCFFEEDARDERGRLRVPKALAINKIGHALHDLDPVFGDFTHDARFDAIARALGMTDPLVYQSMYIFKQPHIGGVVDWHQDATFFATEPQTVLTFWFALEAAHRENGCLLVERGGHRGPLRAQFVRDGETTRMEARDAMPWPAATNADAVEVAAGALVVMHGLLPHYSAPNRSSSSRHAYTLHVTDGAARYDARNWLRRTPEFPARGFVSPRPPTAP